MLHYQLFQRTLIIFSLVTSVGILLHDTKVDQAAKLALPAVLIGYELSTHIPKLGNEGHTHIERVSIGNAVRDLHAGMPRITPRDEHKKYALPKYAKGVQAFDGHYMPLGEL